MLKMLSAAWTTICFMLFACSLFFVGGVSRLFGIVPSVGELVVFAFAAPFLVLALFAIGSQLYATVEGDGLKDFIVIGLTLTLPNVAIASTILFIGLSAVGTI